MVVLDGRGTRYTTSASSERDQVALLLDHMTVAIETMRAQWRTEADLNTHERMAISQLRMYGAMPMSELASRLALSRAAITSLVDRLEATGWLVRSADTVDRRRVLLRLRTHSKVRFDEIAERFATDLAALVEDVDESTWAGIETFLRGVTELAEQHAGELRATASTRALL